MGERALEKWALMHIARLKRWGEPKLVMMLSRAPEAPRRRSLPLAKD
jgi:murein endopeptidase